MTGSAAGIPIADVLTGLEVPPLPGNAPAQAVMALIRFVDQDGDVSWAGWGDFETTRVSP